MALTDIAIRQAKPKDKIYFLPDGRGLILEVRPTGGKSWVVRYYIKGKEGRKVVGEYPSMSLAQAREECLKIKSMAKAGEINKPQATIPHSSFEDIYREWLEVKVIPSLSKSYAEKTILRVNRHVLPYIGRASIKEITSADILQLCRSIESAGTIDTAHRIRQIIGQIFRYAIAAGHAENDPTGALHGALRSHKKEHYATITDTGKITLLMRSIHSYPYNVVRIAILFSVYTFCRPGEIRHAEWGEIDWDKHEWRLPPEKMKMRRTHIVPLASQSVQILRELNTITAPLGKWLFPSERRDGRSMSENTVRVALRAMGYSKEEMTAHGFRSMASTTLNENGFPPDVIERQLAHAERNAIRAAYNHAEYLPERRKMMQWWADWLDGLMK